MTAAFVIIDNNTNKDIIDLENEFKKVDGVNKVISVYDLLDSGIPKSMLPKDIENKLYKDNETIIMVTFNGSTSEDETINSVRELRQIVEGDTISSMTAMVVDTMDLSNKEILIYIVIAVLLCIIVL